MKKFLTFFFSAVLVMGLGIGFMACGHPHEHNITWTTVSDATCTQEGLRTGVCDGCDETFSEKIAMLPHSYGDWLVLKGATCQEEGSRKRTCSVCQHAETETLPKTDHFAQITQVEVAPKCEENGYTEEIKCSQCGTVLKERKEIAALGHKFGAWQEIEPATCQHGGRRECSCEICGTPKIDYTSALAHDWGQCEPVAERPGFHKHKCNTCQTEEILDCFYAPEQVVNPTCTTDGKRFETCVECGYEAVIQILSASGHSLIYVPEPVVDETSSGHKHQHYQKCQNCDEYEKVLTDCNLQTQRIVPGTCTTAEYEIQVCSDCGVEHEVRTKEAPGHSWIYEQKTAYPSARHVRRCANCDIAAVNEACSLTQTRQKQDCTHGASATYTCIYCENSRTISEGNGPLGHDYREDWTFDGTVDQPFHKRVCHRDGCQEFERVACQPESVNNLPTCVEPGEAKTACKVCLEVLSGSELKPLGHTWSEEWTRVGDQHYHECQTCHEREFKPHDFDEVFVPAQVCGIPDKTKYTCKECEYSYEENLPGTVKTHRWRVTSISDDHHVAQCEECQTISEIGHDWSESNICSVCQYDGLIYEVVSEHAIVKKSTRLKTAKTKNIIINPQHKVLDENGQYQNTEYRVTEIEDSAFFDFDSIEHVVLPYTLERIGRYAFNQCSHLQDVNLVSDEQNKPNLKRIEDSAFYYCTALQTFNPPDTLVYIGAYAFANCTTLYEITIPETVEDIEPSAFLNTQFTNDSKNWTNDMLYLGKHLVKVRNVLQGDGAYTNTKVTVRDGTLTIAANAFSECQELVEISLPESLNHIDANAFLNCEKLSQVEFRGDVYKWLSITFVNDYSSPLYYGNAGLHVANVGEDGVVDLTDSEVVKHKITHIPSGTFRGTNLREIILPETLISIGEEAFENCANLVTITFAGDSNLAYVGKNVLKGCTKYLADEQNWDAEHKVLYMGGKVLVEADKSLSGTYNVKEGTLIIVAEAFKDCINLEKVRLSATLRYVGELAFDGCKGMKTLEFADPSYVWLCMMVKDGFSRALDSSHLNWGSLQNYKYSWKRLYKDTENG